MGKSAFKKSYGWWLGTLLFLGLGIWLLYQNRQNLYPTVKEVKYLRADMARDTALVRAGLLVQNWSPVPFRIDSVNYIIRNNGIKLGWGGQVVGKNFGAFGDRLLNFRLYLNTEKYLAHLAQQKNHDSLDLEVAMAVYFDLPFREPDTLQLYRTITTAIPKAPAFAIDTLLVKSFSPQKGYLFMLQLNTGNSNLPNLKLSDLKYDLEFADGTYVDGRIDSTFVLREGQATIQVPLRLETAEMVALLRKKLSGKKRWFYKARASGMARTDHPLFEKLKVSLSKEGSLDASQFSDEKAPMPSLKQVKSLELVSHEKQTFLKARLVIHNPTPLPLYIDSARYTVRYQGKMVAQGNWNYEKTFPKNADQELKLQLAVNNQQYQKMMQQAQGKNEIPLQVKLDLIYDLKDEARQKLTFQETLKVPVPETGGLEVAGLKIKELDPEKGASLLLQLKVQNNKVAGLEVNDLYYQVQLGPDVEISGKTAKPLQIPKGVSEVEVPLQLSAQDVNLLVRRMLQGTQDWQYQFAGGAVVSSENGMLDRTKLAFKTSGKLEPNGKNKQNLVPQITRIDSLNITIKYDTAWARLRVNVYNPLPVSLTVHTLGLEIIHKDKPFARLLENQTHVLKAHDTTAAWLTLHVDYARWERHLKHHQHDDSLNLTLPLRLTFGVGNLPPQTVPLQFTPRMAMPYTPVTLLQKSRLAGFSRAGLKLNGNVLVQNANVKDLELSNLAYSVTLDNGVDFCGTVNRTYRIPLNHSNQNLPFSLSLPEALKMVYRQFFGSPEMHFKLNATAQIRTSSPKLENLHLTFQQENVANLKQKPQPVKRAPTPPKQVARQ